MYEKEDFKVIKLFALIIGLLKIADQNMVDNPGEIWGSRGCEYSILSNVLYKLNPLFEWQFIHILDCMYMLYCNMYGVGYVWGGVGYVGVGYVGVVIVKSI